jgi:hypothetical protein
MSYENLPDPRPLGVKLSIGSMPRLVAVTVLTVTVILLVASIVGLFVDSEHVSGWGGGALLFALLVGIYVYAIRWSDMNKAWPRKRSYRRQRSMR